MPGKTQIRGSHGPHLRLDKLSDDLQKILQEMGSETTSRNAHRLRTTIRRIEVATEPAGKFRGAKKLQRHLDSLRRAAGRIRDIDVQVELLKHLHADDYGDDCRKLQAALASRRSKQEQRFATVSAKELEKGLPKRLEYARAALQDVKPEPVHSRERVERIRSQFVHFTREVPEGGEPLHELRKACKRLRYRLEAIPGRESRSLEKSLKGVQDAIGLWHDWATLTDEAEKRLGPGSIAFVAYLRSLTISKRHEARRAVASLRERLLSSSSGKKPPSSAAHPRPHSKIAG